MPTPRPTASAARPSRIIRSRRSAARARASRSWRAEREQPVGAAVQRAGPLLGGAQRQPGVHLALPGGTGGLAEALAVGGVRLLLGAVLRGREPGLELGQAGQVALVRLLGLRDRALEALGLAAGGAGLRAVLAELLGHRRQRRVGLVQLGQRDVDPLLRIEALGLHAGRLEREPLPRRGRLGELGRWRRRPRPGPRSGDGWAEEPPEAKWAPSTSPSRVTAVTSASSATSARAAGRSSTTAILNSSRVSGGPQLGRALHHVHGVRRVAGQAGPVGVGGRASPRGGSRRGRGRRP